jgi:class 3 adenylate cyclase/tetratricopeptide (TPR) repeat protein
MACPFCDFQNQPNHSYCGRCGKKLPTTALLGAGVGALQGERKQVTVMFADISGFTAMSEQRDAEEVVTLVNACFAKLSECVYRYEGTIDKYIGDAIMAVFGAPRAHEDDPERAIRTALTMREALDEFNANPPLPLTEPLGLHIGISTGYVIAGLIGTERRQDYTVMGDAVNLASRLEDVSDRGQIFVSDGTYRLTSRLFLFEGLDPVTVKGKADPVKIYEVLGAQEQPGTMRGLSGLRAPLVGRDADIQKLSLAVSDLQAGRGGIVLVEGEAGIGKSRLVAEARHNLKGIAPGFLWLEGRGLSYGRSLSYHLLAGVLRNYLGLSDEDDETRVWLKLRATGPELLGSRADEVLPYLAMLLGLRLPEAMAEEIPQADPQLLQQRVFVAFGEWVEAVGAGKPLVLAFDDLHWADPSSVAIIEYLMALTMHNSLLILCVSRPDREAPFWEVRERAMTVYADTLVHIPLHPLSVDESRILVDSLLQMERLPLELERVILSRAEGNPLFVEEVLRTLIEEGTLSRDNGNWQITRTVDVTEIPDTLQGVLTARIDRLDEAMKGVVQIAAVVGRVFQRHVLDRVVDDPSILDHCLAQLEIAQIIRERSPDPEPEYIFKHILTQEAAYQSLLNQQRRAYHRRVADALARLFWERGEEYAGLVAAHYERAEAWPRALRYLQRAGDAARTSFAIKEAIDYYSRALQVADRLGDVSKLSERLSLYERRGELLARLASVEEALDDYQQMHELAQTTGDKKAELRALNEIGALQAGSHEYVRAADYINQALALARDIGDQAGIADSLNRLGGFHFNTGKWEEAQSYHREALEIARALDNNALLAASLDGLGQIDLMRGRVRASLDKYGQIADLHRRLGDQAGLMETLNALAAAYNWLGEYRQVADACEEALTFVGKVGNLPVVSSLYTYLAISYLNRGDLGAAGSHLREAIQVARSLDHVGMQVLCLTRMAYYHLILGWNDVALETADEAVGLAQKLGSPLWEMRARTSLGIARLYRGELSEAVELLGDVYDLACALGSAPDQAMVLYELGRANLLVGDLKAAGQALEELLSVADRGELREYQTRGCWLQGRLALAQADLDQSLEALEDAHARAEAIGARLILWRADSALGDVHRAAGRSAEANATYQRAWETLQAIAATLPDEESRERMLAVPSAAELRERIAAGE